MAFIKVADLAELPEGRGVLLERAGHAIALFNAGAGRVHATSPLCPHEDGPLADGWIEGDAVVCPWHGFDFDLATGGCRVDENLSIAVYPTRVVDSTVEVDLP